ncbi:MAG: hypothetical protein ACRCWS_02400 [Propionibacteriaceae bacterium]
MSLEFLKATCHHDELEVEDLRLTRIIYRGRVDGKAVLACAPHVDGASVCILDDGERSWLALVAINGQPFWQRPDTGVRFFGIDHGHQPIACRMADGTQQWFDYETGEPTQHKSRAVDGCCCG